MHIGRVAVSLLLDERPIPGHVIEGLKDCFQGNPITTREFFGGKRVGSVDDLVNHRRSDPSPFEEELAVIRAGRGSRC